MEPQPRLAPGAAPRAQLISHAPQPQLSELPECMHSAACTSAFQVAGPMHVQRAGEETSQQSGLPPILVPPRAPILPSFLAPTPLAFVLGQAGSKTDTCIPTASFEAHSVPVLGASGFAPAPHRGTPHTAATQAASPLPGQSAPSLPSAPLGSPAPSLPAVSPAVLAAALAQLIRYRQPGLLPPQHPSAQPQPALPLQQQRTAPSPFPERLIHPTATHLPPQGPDLQALLAHAPATSHAAAAAAAAASGDAHGVRHSTRQRTPNNHAAEYLCKLAAKGGNAAPPGKKRTKAAGQPEGQSAVSQVPMSPEHARCLGEVAAKFPAIVGPLLTNARAFRYRGVCRHWRDLLPVHVTELRGDVVGSVSAATLRGMAASDVRLRLLEVPWTNKWTVERTQAVAALIQRQASRGYLRRLQLEATVTVKEVDFLQANALRQFDPAALASECVLQTDLVMLDLIAHKGVGDRVFPHVTDLVLTGSRPRSVGEWMSIEQAKRTIEVCFPSLLKLSAFVRGGHELSSIATLTHFTVSAARSVHVAARLLGATPCVDIYADDGVLPKLPKQPLQIGTSMQAVCLLDVATYDEDSDASLTAADYASFVSKHPALRLLAVSATSPLPYPVPDSDSSGRVLLFPQGHHHRDFSNRLGPPAVSCGAEFDIKRAREQGPDATRSSLATLLAPFKMAAPQPAASLRRPTPAPVPAFGPGSALYGQDVAWVEQQVGAPVSRGPTALCILDSFRSRPILREHPDMQLTGSPGLCSEAATITDLRLPSWAFPDEFGALLPLPGLQRVHLIHSDPIAPIGTLHLIPDTASGSADTAAPTEPPPTEDAVQGSGHDTCRNSSGRYVHAFLRQQGRRIAFLHAQATAPQEAAALHSAGVLHHARSVGGMLASSPPAYADLLDQLQGVESVSLQASARNTSDQNISKLAALVAALPRVKSVTVQGAVARGMAGRLQRAVEQARPGVSFRSL